MIILRGVNVFPTQIEDQLMTVSGLAPHFQIELSKPRRMDEMRVLVESSRDFSAPEVRQRSAAELRDKLKANIEITVTIDVADPGGVARSQGKAIRIIDKRPTS